MNDEPVQQHQAEPLDRREPRLDPGDPATADEPGRADGTDERRGFDGAAPGTLREQADLLDDDGEDIRMYTGEPVETDDGWVLPQQQNLAGKDNIAGGGEWPDTDAPPAEPPPAE